MFAETRDDICSLVFTLGPRASVLGYIPLTASFLYSILLPRRTRKARGPKGSIGSPEDAPTRRSATTTTWLPGMRTAKSETRLNRFSLHVLGRNRHCTSKSLSSVREAVDRNERKCHEANTSEKWKECQRVG